MWIGFAIGFVFGVVSMVVCWCIVYDRKDGK